MLFPYRDENVTQRRSVITVLLIAANVVVWLVVQGAGATLPLARSVCNLGLIPGELTGVAVWLAASAGFSTYRANFKIFNVTYGTFAAAIILLVWLWLTNVALLFGAEINAGIERATGKSGPRPLSD